MDDCEMNTGPAVRDWKCGYCSSQQADVRQACASCGAERLEAAPEVVTKIWTHPYTAASQLDFMRILLVSVVCFGAFGALHASGAEMAHWLLLLAPIIGSTWFGATGHWLPLEKLLVGGALTGMVGILWLAWDDWLRLAWPSDSLVMVALLVIGTVSYALGAALGGCLRSATRETSP